MTRASRWSDDPKLPTWRLVLEDEVAVSLSALVGGGCMSDKKPWEEEWSSAGHSTLGHCIDFHNGAACMVSGLGLPPASRWKAHIESEKMAARIRLMAVVPDLVRVLLAVEWVQEGVREWDDEGSCTDLYRCPWCEATREVKDLQASGDHRLDCPREMALRKAGVR
jgi:hypothetical protein